jgi:hypothetical protein
MRSSLTFKTNMSIREIGDLIESHFRTQWEKILEENYDELLQSYKKLGDPAYGIYLKELMAPVFDQLKKAGYVASTLNLHNSLEEWGPIENRDRMLWSVVKDSDDHPIGTFIVDLFHSHVHFELPSIPQVYVVEETTRDNIFTAIHRIKESL